MEKIKNFEEWNEKMAIQYNPDNYHNSSNVIIRWIEGVRTGIILKMLNAVPEDNIIELGCGAGNIMDKIKDGHLVGVDISDTMLQIARRKFSNHPGIELYKENVEELSERISGRKFTKVYCSEVLEHVEHPVQVIDQILKITDSDSLIVISIPNEKLINKIKRAMQRMKIFDLLFPGISKQMDEEWHLHSFDLDMLREITRNKLEEIEVRGAPMAWLPIRYVVKFQKR